MRLGQDTTLCCSLSSENIHKRLPKESDTRLLPILVSLLNIYIHLRMQGHPFANVALSGVKEKVNSILISPITLTVLCFLLLILFRDFALVPHIMYIYILI